MVRHTESEMTIVKNTDPWKLEAQLAVQGHTGNTSVGGRQRGEGMAWARSFSVAFMGRDGQGGVDRVRVG